MIFFMTASKVSKLHIIVNIEYWIDYFLAKVAFL